jgi:hypothetical protein
MTEKTPVKKEGLPSADPNFGISFLKQGFRPAAYAARPPCQRLKIVISAAFPGCFECAD